MLAPVKKLLLKLVAQVLLLKQLPAQKKVMLKLQAAQNRVAKLKEKAVAKKAKQKPKLHRFLSRTKTLVKIENPLSEAGFFYAFFLKWHVC